MYPLVRSNAKAMVETAGLHDAIRYPGTYQREKLSTMRPLGAWYVGRYGSLEGAPAIM